MKPQTLLFDADDTLWENSLHFEQAIADFITFLDHRVHTPTEVRDVLNRCERTTIAAHGYGLRSFHRSLAACFEQLTAAPLTPAIHVRLETFAKRIATQEIELLPDVYSTLATLAARHRLILVTKGDPDEQIDKLHRSGLRAFFTAVEVPAEKDEALYRALLHRHNSPPATTWMIGNSPRSDINPALAAGLHAAFLSHTATWVLEDEPLQSPAPGQILLRLSRFADLLTHF